MKNFYFSFVVTLILLISNSLISFAQAPEGFTYQAEARDESGKLLTTKTLTVEITILKGSSSGEIAWQKDYDVTTDSYGLFTIVIGEMDGINASTGSFSAIDWGFDTYFLNVKIIWSKKWLDMGTTQLLSVPYALYAKTAESANITETDPVVKAVNGLVKSNGTDVAAAVAGTDYLTPGQAVTAVMGTAPIASSGGTVPVISINPATTSEAGSMSAEDKVKIDGVATGAEVNVNADWNATTGDALILNKPDLSVYAMKNMENQNITNLADPVNLQDAATKAYVDALRSEVNILKLKVAILAGTPVSELLASGATLEDLLAAGVTIGNLLNAGATINDLLGAGATTDQFIGVEYQGGKIAYFLQSGDPGYDPAVAHGIIAAPFDQAVCFWGPDEYDPSGTSTSIGSGAANTEIIVNTLQYSSGFAAKICSDLVLNGYDDWCLPSKDELNQLYLNKTAIGEFTNQTNQYAYYWSSSVYSLGNWDTAWSQSFSSGSQEWNRIVYTYLHVRAIRYF